MTDNDPNKEDSGSENCEEKKKSRLNDAIQTPVLKKKNSKRKSSKRSRRRSLKDMEKQIQSEIERQESEKTEMGRKNASLLLSLCCCIW